MVDIAVSGQRLQVTDDAYSDRVRCDHPEIEDGRALGRGLSAAAELMGRGRVVVMAEQRLEGGLSAVGYETEAVMPGFYNGANDCVVMGLAREPEREGPGFPAGLERVEAVLEAKGEPMPPPDDVQTRAATLSDAPALAELIGETFQSYPTPSNDPAYVAKQMREGTPFRVVEDGDQLVACASAEAAMEGAGIVTTCTADKRLATILTDNMVGPGIHINAVGGDSPGKTELHRDILLRSGIFVEYPPQTRIEGEIQQLDEDHPVIELWQVMAGKAKGRTDANQITLFDSVGFAIEDFSALRYVHAKAQETGLYTELDMVADPDDPRDLFGMLLRAR